MGVFHLKGWYGEIAYLIDKCCRKLILPFIRNDGVLPLKSVLPPIVTIFFEKGFASRGDDVLDIHCLAVAGCAVYIYSTLPRRSLVTGAL